jgi:hypothetical protein
MAKVGESVFFDWSSEFSVTKYRDRLGYGKRHDKKAAANVAAWDLLGEIRSLVLSNKRVRR